MAKRIKIAINYLYDENWIGGTYYIQNLISSLNNLNDIDKPYLYIISANEDDYIKLKDYTGYPYLQRLIKNKNYNLLKRLINFLSRFMLSKNLFDTSNKYDIIFPSAFYIDKLQLKKQLFWIPDFQEKYLPHFFSEEEINMRNSSYTEIQKKSKNLIFSSIDAQNDFNKFYPKSKPQQFVLRFATSHEKHNLPDYTTLIKKYDLTTRYFLCSNQFWIHKNQNIVLESLAILKEKNIYINVVFTGKQIDSRNPDYFENIKKLAKELGVIDQIKFLGFIPREDQILLMQNCTAIVQPSLFEGWSTVNEDAKYQNCFIISSNLNVNKEQLEGYPNYVLFDPTNAKELASILNGHHFPKNYYDYGADIKNFSENFIKIVKTIVKNNLVSK